VARRLGDNETARQRYEEQLALAKRMKYRKAEARALGHLALTCAAVGQSERALKCHRESLQLFRETGEQRGVAEELINGAQLLATMPGADRAAAAELAREGLRLLRELNDPRLAKAEQDLQALLRDQPAP
jgi:tetratricopeptide (TPR) repeat protein